MSDAGSFSVEIVCDAGGAPRLELRAEGLTRIAWEALRAAVDEAWRELRVPCTCGHAYAAHSRASPHACYAPVSCACTTFQAASPVVVRP